RERPQLGREGDSGRARRVVERLDAEAVAHEKGAAAGGVPQAEGVDPVEPLGETPRAPLLVAVDVRATVVGPAVRERVDHRVEPRRARIADDARSRVEQQSGYAAHGAQLL